MQTGVKYWNSLCEAIAAGLDERAAEAGSDASVERWLEGMARKFGTGPDGHPLLPETKTRRARLAYRVFRGERPALLGDFSTWAGADAELATECLRQLLGVAGCTSRSCAS